MSVQDEALAGMVSNAFMQDKRISGQAIAARVVDGDVFLKGIVDTEEQKALAMMIVHGVAGVRHVNGDELRVREVIQ